MRAHIKKKSLQIYSVYGTYVNHARFYIYINDLTYMDIKDIKCGIIEEKYRSKSKG